MRTRSLLLLGLLPAVLAGSASVAAPSCTLPGTAPACGDRIVPEPLMTATFQQFDGPLEGLGATLEAIEALAPDFLEVKPIAEWTGDPEHRSVDGREVYAVRVTDERVAREGKRQVAVSLSVHGLESAGREGGLRYVEDLARWAVGDPDRLLYSGDIGFPVSEVLARTETWLAFTNPDGWAAGDLHAGGAGFERGNGDGVDLNRDFATVGFYDRSGNRGLAESEPETRAWTSLVRSLPNLTTSADIHGEITTPNDAFSDLIVPAGQWDPTRQDQVAQLAKNMIRTVERKFADHGVVLEQVLAPIPSDGATPRKPANVAAAYDIVGYDDSGFMGDWFSQTQDSVHMDVENFLSHLAPNNAWVGLLENAHVAAVRGNIEATIVEALVTDQVRPTADLGRVAYVDDPVRTRSDETYALDGEPGAGVPVEDGEEQAPYDVSRLDYFRDLSAAYGLPVDAVTADAVAAGDLSGYDTLVVADLADLPHGATTTRAAYVAGLRAFAEQGGQLLLTDGALTLAADLGLVPADAVTLDRTNAGHVDFAQPLGDHPFEEGLFGKVSQTYYEVMLGWPAEGSAPNHGIATPAWEAAGGSTVATIEDDSTALGSAPLGAGLVTVFGSVLPQATEEFPHPHGLASYGVTIAGGQVLDNVLSYRRS